MFTQKKRPEPNQTIPPQLDTQNIPRHIAVIMDGNGRWAKKRGLPRVFGHRFGMRRVKEIVRACGSLGVSYLTLYAFSKENWSRPPAEVSSLMGLLREYLKKELAELQENDVRLRTIGRTEELPAAAREILLRSIEKTKNNKGLTLVLALNYGGRSEIVDGVNKALRAKGKSRPKTLDEKTFSTFLYTSDIPDPDLLVRTSGEMRLSNFLLWQLAYSEIWVTPVLWPDFTREHLVQAIADYQKRERRFGGIAKA